jgi:hypothetical protein
VAERGVFSRKISASKPGAIDRVLCPTHKSSGGATAGV